MLYEFSEKCGGRQRGLGREERDAPLRDTGRAAESDKQNEDCARVSADE